MLSMRLGAQIKNPDMVGPLLTATTPCSKPPRWAVLQRQLFDDMEAALDVYLEKYTNDDGTLIYAEEWSDGRDGLDDLYEAFYNIPLLYLLGGSADLLERAHFHWEAVNKQAAGFGLVKDEYEVGFDQFHQSEGNLFFCLLCAADPDNLVLQERARRFADLYLGLPNYDPDKNIIRAVHTGSGGPRWGYLDGQNIFTPFMQHFGLAFHDLDGINSFDDVADWHEGHAHEANRTQMVEVMDTRMGQGDSIANLLATSLVTNAYLMSGEPHYALWVETYTLGWWDRTATNDGIPPDNVGLDGQVGAQFDGHWFGAAYGWTWPLGYDYIGDFLAVAGMNAALVSGSTNWLEMPGQVFDMIYERAHLSNDFTANCPPRPDRWIAAACAATADPSALVAPKKRGSQGWFADYPFQVGALTNTWCTAFAPADFERLRALEAAEPQDWNASYAFRSKGDDGHERPWLAYLSGKYDAYPEVFLEQSLTTVAERMRAVCDDQSDLSQVHIHHWQNHNPVTTEALVQLTLGGPQQRYNGGPFRTCFRYFDVDANRPGLPPDVGALVQSIDEYGASVMFVNVNPTEQRTLRVQGGFYGEHEITVVRDTSPGEQFNVNGASFEVSMQPGTMLELEISLNRMAQKPSLLSH